MLFLNQHILFNIMFNIMDCCVGCEVVKICCMGPIMAEMLNY